MNILAGELRRQRAIALVDAFELEVEKGRQSAFLLVFEEQRAIETTLCTRQWSRGRRALATPQRSAG